MMATIFLSDPHTGLTFSARAAVIDEGGRPTDPVLMEAIEAGGWRWEVVRDWGLMAQRWRDLYGLGVGWGRRSPTVS